HCRRLHLRPSRSCARTGSAQAHKEQEAMLMVTVERAALRPDGDADELKRRDPLRRFWNSAAGFWGHYGRPMSWLLSAALLLIILLNLAASYGMNVWHRVIFDALQARDSDTVLLLSTLYVPLLAGSVLLSVMQVCARMTMQRRWREWLNNLLIDRWVKDSRHYQLNLVRRPHKNPQGRIA